MESGTTRPHFSTFCKIWDFGSVQDWGNVRTEK
jgi:hypothetical protein